MGVFLFTAFGPVFAFVRFILGVILEDSAPF